MELERIKYRAKDKFTGRWVYGFPNNTKLNNWFIYAGDRRYCILPETLGQYTGLKDKDGKEIYEGDIIMMIGCRYIVCYASTHARFLFLRQDGDGYEEPNDRRCSDYLIIGNIFDNKNLLEQ